MTNYAGSSNMSSTSTPTSLNNAKLEETRQLNKKSAQNKGLQ
jgi:hypothetical protein